MGHLWRWLAHVLGQDNASGTPYLAWSGWVSAVLTAVGDLSAVALAVAAYHRLNCHVGGCWRIGRHRVGASNLVVCSHHHPRRTSWWARHRHGHRARVTAEAVAAIPPRPPPSA